jgi:hypothetical protein
MDRTGFLFALMRSEVRAGDVEGATTVKDMVMVMQV